jgi:SHS2 domain-containing protein
LVRFQGGSIFCPTGKQNPQQAVETRKNYQLLDHTADIAIRVKGKGLKDLFKNAAAAIFDIIAERQKKEGKISHIKVVQEAQNADELFVNWLNELISLSFAKNLVFTDFEIESISGNHLKATAFAEDSKNFRMNTEIKAATYHELKLEKSPRGWQAKVILDV